mmetsp:Transcript_88448/g.225209  ORF Transcript_88448/g.225209 Transcript_88448/m.225209 type:complete len:212 (-) Transcript_88448:544-1179(-)
MLNRTEICRRDCRSNCARRPPLRHPSKSGASPRQSPAKPLSGRRAACNPPSNYPSLGRRASSPAGGAAPRHSPRLDRASANGCARWPRRSLSWPRCSACRAPLSETRPRLAGSCWRAKTPPTDRRRSFSRQPPQLPRHSAAADAAPQSLGPGSSPSCEGAPRLGRHHEHPGWPARAAPRSWRHAAAATSTAPPSGPPSSRRRRPSSAPGGR